MFQNFSAEVQLLFQTNTSKLRVFIYYLKLSSFSIIITYEYFITPFEFRFLGGWSSKIEMASSLRTKKNIAILMTSSTKEKKRKIKPVVLINAW